MLDMNASPTQRFTARLHELLADAEELLAAASTGADHAKEATTDALREAREHLANACDAASGRARKIDRYVHDNPWKAVAATGLVAFLLGLLVRRR